MQKHRLAKGGSIDRDKLIYFTFNNRLLQGYVGDSLASALLANNIRLIARSIKYHRARGIVSAGLEEASALVSCHDKNNVFVPNLKVTEIKLKENLVAKSQNCWPSVELDLGALLQSASALLSAGFYYKTFMWPKQWWHQLYEKLIRRAAGQGRVSKRADAKLYDRRIDHCDLLIVGSGPAGLAAALACIDCGISVLLLEQDHHLGGSSLWEQDEISSLSAQQWREQAIEKIEAAENIHVRLNTLVFGHYDHGQIMAIEHSASVVDSVSWKIHANRIVLATGATEKPLVFPDNDRPGIMLAASVRQYIYRYAVAPGSRAYLAITDATELEQTRQALNQAGIEISGELKGGERICATRGRLRLKQVVVTDQQGVRTTTACDLLCMSNGWNPNAQLIAQLGGRLEYDSNIRNLLPPEQEGPMLSSGACRGLSRFDDCVADGQRQALQAIAQINSKIVDFPPVDISPLASIPTQARTCELHDGRGKSFVDFQNDVIRADLELAVQEGYENVELVKRYTTLGMGTDQGKTSWVNAISELERLTGQDATAIGHTTFRPPYSPVSFGALVGAEVDQHMTPTRHTPFHQAFHDSGCVFQTSGDWIYSRYFPQHDETMDQSIRREVLAVRNSVGCVDMSTLGKVDVKGDDALEFLSRLYCNNVDSIQPGRLRYALILREDAVLFDDGTIAQLAENHFLVTITTANSASVWRWMNKLLQLHWQELDVQLTSVSDHWASLAIAGPNARLLLQKLEPDFKVDRDSFPFASVREGKLCDNLPCRIFSVSFSGELSYEINVPAGFAGQLFKQILEQGAEFDITPYGLEALDVLRIEKGHLSIGTEIDGRTTAADLGLGKLVSTKKSFLGSSMLHGSELNQPKRKQLVGLVPADGHSPIPVAALVCDQPWQAGVSQTALGQLTASISSPTLGHPIALALLEGGQSSSTKKLWAVSPLENKSVEVTVCSSCFVDPSGEHMHA
jgi:glycine cleavage system aminomethyltransferase T/NADPH-dependent 2,4-dienoyl-CoA reductase/sulfur reductase-like enzyme